jgi:nucleoside 2-deoxyribosyltransferase
MKIYFDHIDDAEVVVILNEKGGREYYGIGTTIELGYALARNKRIAFTRHATNPNILSLMLSNKRNIGLLERGETSKPVRGER